MNNTIIQITMLKNELLLLKELLPIWKNFADGFVFYDDGSTDGSREYLESNKEKFNILEIITVNHDEEQLRMESNNRQLLFDAALKYSNKIICLDADEYLDGDMTKDELVQILNSRFDCVFYLRWVQYTSANTIRVDGPWGNNIKDRIGVYSKPCKFPTQQMHTTHLPLTISQELLDPSKLFISHLQWLNKNTVAIKQYYWKICDYITKNKFNTDSTPASAYDASVNDFQWEEEYFDYPLRIRDDVYEDITDNYRIKFIVDSTIKYKIPNLGDWGKNITDSVPMYFCTASDEKHFPLLMNLIGTIHKFHFYDLVEIGVYDLGFNSQQRRELNNIKKVKVYDVEKTNPHIMEMIETGKNRSVRGLFSWKPVIIKQSLDKYPYVVYMDAGTTILKPINNLFKHVIEHGYFLVDCGHSIKWMTTKYVINKLKVGSELLTDDIFGIDAGFMGVSQTVYNSFIKPAYELSSDITNFVDDGTCPGGYGCGRHDQTLFSIIARRLKMDVNYHEKTPAACYLKVNNRDIPFNVVHDPKKINGTVDLFRSRWNLERNSFKSNLAQIKRKYIISVVTGIGPLGKYEKFIENYFQNIQSQIMFSRTEHIIVYSEWSHLFDKYISYPNILFIKEAERLGVYNAWNIGIQNASSEYITNWNVDDLRHPLNTKLKYDLLNINPEIALAYNYYVASSTGETFYNINMDSKSILKFPDDYHLHATKACLAGPDPMWRKSMHYVVGLFDYKRFSVAGDWDMWIRFAKAGYQFKLIPEVMCIYTDHPNTVSQQMNAKLEKEKQLINQLYN